MVIVILHKLLLFYSVMGKTLLVTCLYYMNRSNKAPGYAMITKLKYEHVVLTSYSKMRIDLATQVMYPII